MTKADIVESVLNATGMSKKDAFDVVECFFDTVKGVLESGEELKIMHFGNFEIKAKTARRGRNPQTGEEMILPARKILTFRASKTLKLAVNGGAVGQGEEA